MRGSDKELQLCAPIAQLVEQMTLNHWVLGSSPRGRTIFFAFISPAILKSPLADIMQIFIFEINFKLKFYIIPAALR